MGELVTVEVVEVVAVEVRADVRGIGATALGVVEELDVEDLEELLGDSVTVGSIVETTVVPTTPVRVKDYYHVRIGEEISRLTTNTVANTTRNAAATS